MFRLGLLLVIGFVGGVIFGTQVIFAWQFASIVVWIAILNLGPWDKDEMFVIFPFFVCVAFYVGVIVGDISYFIQTGGQVSFDWINNFGDLFKVVNKGET